jgi:diguanylate cyclase (GGDEF)-like protein/PAS domain S-box-containing protein
MHRRSRPPQHAPSHGDVGLHTSRDSRGFIRVGRYGALRSWALASGLLVATVGLAVMVGWLLDVESLKRVGPGLATMKFNTALCLALLGIGITAGSHTLVARVASATVGALATVTLAEYVTGWNVGIDEALFADPAAFTTYPGRMAIITGVCLGLAAMSLRALRLGRRNLVTGTALFLISVGWLGSLGYVFGVREFYDVGHFSTMAAHTAATLVVLGVGLLASTPKGPLPWIVRGDDPGATMLRQILPLALIGMPVAAGLTVIGEHEGWYQAEVGRALMVVVASAGVLAVAMHMARLVNRAHAARVVATQDLHDLNSSLEARIAGRTAELRETVELFRITFESSPVGMALVEADGRIARANDALCELTHHPLRELLTMRLDSILHPESGDNAGKVDRRSVSAENVDQRMVRADGSMCWASIRYAQIGQHVEGGPGLTIVQFVDTTERHQFEDRLAYLANHDSLTGLMNRRSLEASLENHVAHCKRYGPTGAVLILDLDNFKQINDTRGHNVGDQVLVATADLLRRRLRESDLVARMGGDEFVVLLTAGDAAAAAVVAQSIVEEVRAKGATITGDQIAVSASIGVAVFDEVERSPGEMLVNADLAMYDAKELGRNTWAEFATERYDVTRSVARVTWVDRIEAALDNGSFVLHAQPIVDLITGHAVQLELRIRMIGEQGDLIPPGTFLYIAERYGLSNRIDAWVLAQAFDLLEATGADRNPVTIAVNISGPSLFDDQILAMLEQGVRAGRFAPDRLVVQLVETAAISNIAAARAFAERLRSLGCRLSLGGFGAGFASFHHLKHLPFDFIKLDGELVADCLVDSTDRAIIGSLVNLARSLGKETIAEGVNSERVRRFLRQVGVDHGQGSHLSRPVPLHEAVPTFTPRPGRPESESQLTPIG